MEKEKLKEEKANMELLYNQKISDLERQYFEYFEKARSQMDRLRKEFEDAFRQKEKELEEEKNKAISQALKREQELNEKYRKKEEELLIYWQNKVKEDKE